MAFKKGHKKLGGRTKGTINKGTRIFQMGLSRGQDPFETLYDALKHHDVGIRVKAAAILTKYIEPQLSSIEHSGEIESKPSVVVLHDGSKLVFKSEDKE